MSFSLMRKLSHPSSFARWMPIIVAGVLILGGCQSASEEVVKSASDSLDTNQQDDRLTSSQLNDMITLVGTCDPALWPRLEAFYWEYRDDSGFDIQEFWDWTRFEWVACSDAQTRVQVAQSGGIPSEIAIDLLRTDDQTVMDALKANESFVGFGVARLAEHQDDSIRLLAAQFSATSAEVLERLVRDSSGIVRDAAIQNLMQHSSLCGTDIDFDSYFGRYTEKTGFWWEGETTTGRLLVVMPEVTDAGDCLFTLTFSGNAEPIKGQWQQAGLTLTLSVKDPEFRTLSGAVRDNVLRLELDDEAFAKLTPQPMPGQRAPNDDELGP